MMMPPVMAQPEQMPVQMMPMPMPQQMGAQQYAEGVAAAHTGPSMAMDAPMGQPAVGENWQPVPAAQSWQPVEFEPVCVAMPVDGEARKRATLYKDEVMDPNAMAWSQEARPRDDTLPNKKAAPEHMVDSDDDDHDDYPRAAQ